jgi:hypothetical protein
MEGSLLQVYNNKHLRETSEYKQHKIFLRFVFSTGVTAVRTEEFDVLSVRNLRLLTAA